MRISDWSSDVCSSDLHSESIAGAWRWPPPRAAPRFVRPADRFREGGYGPASPLPGGGLHSPPACANRRLYRFLLRHSPRRKCWAAVSARRSAAPQLQICADWLSWTRILGSSQRRGAETAEGTDQEDRKSQRLKPSHKDAHRK